MLTSITVTINPAINIFANIDRTITSAMHRDWLRGIKIFNEQLPLHVVLDAAEFLRDLLEKIREDANA